MPTIGYGEDGLTFHALHAHRCDLLRLFRNQIPNPPGVQDLTRPEDCKVYFRPGFGRAGGDASPQFGEFDAILCTNTVIYLIESKWNSTHQFRPNVRLEPVQILRHRIFAWYYENWAQHAANAVAGPDWPLFVQVYGPAFTLAFPHRPLPPHGSLLARNLQTILTDITQPRRELKNVLLYFSVDGPNQIVFPAAPPEQQVPFHLVTFPYESIGNSRYFQLSGSVNTPG